MPITEKHMQEIEDLAIEGIRALFKENRQELTAACNQTLYQAKDNGKPKFPISITALVLPNGRNKKVKVSFGWGVKNKTFTEMETGEETADMFMDDKK